MTKLSIVIDCNKNTCGKCVYLNQSNVYIANCNLFSKRLDFINEKPLRCKTCIGFEVKS